MRPQYRIRQIRILALLLALALLLPSGAFAQETAAKTVRVGWYESTYCYRDRFGRRRGMAYEYQKRPPESAAFSATARCSGWAGTNSWRS